MSLKKKILNFIINRINLFDAGCILGAISCILFICYIIINAKVLHQSDNIPFTIWLSILGFILAIIWTITGIIGGILKATLTFIHSKIN